jgi:general secretion pathway protein G
MCAFVAKWKPLLVLFAVCAAVLAVSPRSTCSLGSDRRARARVDVCMIAGAVQEFALANQGHFPDSLERLVEPDMQGYRYLALEYVPQDPWGRTYGYRRPADGETEPRVFTLGRDGAAGGDGQDVDIDSGSLIHAPDTH